MHAFTVDVEDYFQVSGFEGQIPRDQWECYECRVAANTRQLLAMLARHQVRATFFVLGWVARHDPELVREIHRGGHEIGNHSYWHRLIYQQTPAEFRADLRQAGAAIEDAIGQRVTAYRAPSFSITARSLWALDILAEEGYQIDSSIFPIHHHRYGIPGAQPRLHRMNLAAGSLWEFPPPVLRLAGLNMPVGGGGYFRLYPGWWTSFCLSRIQRAGHPFLFYIHPWELDPQQPRLRAGSRLGRFRHYVNLARNQRKLEALLQRFRFGSLGDVVAEAQQVRAEPVACGSAV
jgi:polysaccharide deacetylase family protein (PEP-CTERM system associated)